MDGRFAFTLKCPFCSSPDSRVIDSRPADEDQSIRRRRECTVCRQRFTTFEVVERLPLVVIKKDGSRQAYDRNKLLNGLLKACEKRPVPLRSLESIADEIELQLENRLEREIPSRVIGELAMEKLRAVDEIAYIRFASVYRHFTDLSGFAEELNRLLHHDRGQENMPTSTPPPDTPSVQK